ncbi:MAG TPA: sugar transferase, partial [Candidatus Saccharimonadales bacterium]|nr:sugar transferase [Candidatus Saccharimonadales bacterium]
MQNFRRRLLINGYGISDVLVMAVAFSVAIYSSAQRMSLNFEQFLAVRIKLTNLLLFLCFAVAWYLIFSCHGLYRSRRIGQIQSEWWEATKCVMLGTLLLATVAFVAQLAAVNRTFLTVFFVASLSGTLVMRTSLRFMLFGARRKGRNLRNIVIVGCGPGGSSIGRAIRKKPELGYLILGYIDDLPPPQNPLHGQPEKLLGTLAEVERLIEHSEVDEVFIALPIVSYFATVTRIIAICETLGLVVRIPADLFELHLAKADVDYLDDTAVLTLQTGAPASFALVLKRAIDVACSAAALLIVAPVLVAVAIAIKLESKGPVFFRQERIGVGRKKFPLVKFRTMVTDAETRLKELEQYNEVKGAAF